MTRGATLTARVTAETAHGEVTLPDGEVLAFTLPRATGIAGLYDATLAEGMVQGQGGDGQQLRAQVVQTLEQGDGLLAGIITPPDGARRAVATFVTAPATGELRIIVLADGRLIGAEKKGHGSGWVDPDVDPAR